MEGVTQDSRFAEFRVSEARGIQHRTKQIRVGEVRTEESSRGSHTNPATGGPLSTDSGSVLGTALRPVIRPISTERPCAGVCALDVGAVSEVY